MVEPIITIRNLVTKIGTECIHNNLNLDIKRGEVIGIVGGSGSGKTVLLRAILGLLKPTAGQIRILGKDPYNEKNLQYLIKRWGVLFQNGALFSSLNVGQNIMLPMQEILGLTAQTATDIMFLKLGMVGLTADTAYKYPSELSGGMVKRASLARCLANDAKLLFLDEPTAGLDPISAEKFDQLILSLKRDLNLTVMMVTHDLDSLYTICDRVAVLVENKLITGTLEEVQKKSIPWIKQYFHGVRGRLVREKHYGK